MRYYIAGMEAILSASRHNYTLPLVKNGKYIGPSICDNTPVLERSSIWNNTSEEVLYILRTWYYLHESFACSVHMQYISFI